jgi:hypothetical protein
MRIRTSSDEAGADPWLPPGLRGACQRYLVDEDGPHPAGRAGSRRRRVRAIVVLAGRATKLRYLKPNDCLPLLIPSQLFDS